MNTEMLRMGFEAFEAGCLPFVVPEDDLDECLKRLLEAPREEEPEAGKPSHTSDEGEMEMGPKHNLRRACNLSQDDARADVGEPSVILTATPMGRRFSMYTARPSELYLTEKYAFKHLKDIATAVSECEVKGRDRNGFSFRLCPNNNVESGMPSSDNRIDACIASDSGKLQTMDIAVAMEFKLKTTDTLQNCKQFASANSQVMNDDARRMFCYGITIEDDWVSVWYHSRSYSAVCEPFSLIDDPERLVKVLLSFLFATEDELGYDPHVQRHDDGYYLYDIPQEDGTSRWYRTFRSIYEYHSTRIFEVARVHSFTNHEEDGPRMVLEDVWLDKDAPTEKQIQEKIFQAIDKFSSNPDWESDPCLTEMEDSLPTLCDHFSGQKYKRLFLTIADDYVGWLSKPHPTCAKRCRELFDDPPTSAPEDSRGASNPIHEFTKTRPLSKVEVAQLFSPKRQYRVIYEEVCTALRDLKTLGEVIGVVEDCFLALKVMLCAGWVHRDISTGNVLAYRKTENEPWKVKLSDLEYAKTFPPDGPPSVEPKIGTPHFMAYEILQGNYMFKPRQPLEGPHRSDRDLVRNLIKGYADSGSPSPVVHNFQHDLESLWFASRVFHFSLDPPPARQQFFEFRDFTGLRKSLGPDLIRFASSLEHGRDVLVVAYDLREIHDQTMDHGAYSLVYSLFSGVFAELKEAQEAGDNPTLKVRKKEEPTNSRPPRAKRLRNSDDDDDTITEGEEDHDEDDKDIPKSKRNRTRS